MKISFRQVLSRVRLAYTSVYRLCVYLSSASTGHVELDRLYALRSSLTEGLCLSSAQVSTLKEIVDLVIRQNDDAEVLEGDLQDWISMYKDGPERRAARCPNGTYAYAGQGFYGWGLKSASEAKGRIGVEDKYESGAD